VNRSGDSRSTRFEVGERAQLAQLRYLAEDRQRVDELDRRLRQPADPQQRDPPHPVGDELSDPVDRLDPRQDPLGLELSRELG
jgi:hypothetical protein